MTLAEASLHRRYRILNVDADPESPLGARFRQLGFVPGVELACEAMAPLLKHPLLVSVRGTQVALARAEAARVRVEEA
jgi:Fe2+ transport system protein FeoA